MEKIPAESFAADRGIPVSAVLARINSGIYSGVEEDGVWYVLRQPSSSGTADSSPARTVSAEPVERVTHYTSQTFVRVLSAVLIVLIAFNALTLFLGAWLAVIPIAFQAVVLTALRQRWPRTRTIVRAWAVVLIISGVGGLVAWLARFAMYLQDDPTAFSDVIPWLVPVQFAALVGGIAVFALSGRHIQTEERTIVPQAS